MTLIATAQVQQRVHRSERLDVLPDYRKDRVPDRHRQLCVTPARSRSQVEAALGLAEYLLFLAFIASQSGCDRCFTSLNMHE